MKFLRGSTSSPISVVKIWSAASFVVGDRAFAWDFSVAPMVSHVDLNDIAPPGLLDHRVTAFVARDPHYAAP